MYPKTIPNSNPMPSTSAPNSSHRRNRPPRLHSRRPQRAPRPPTPKPPSGPRVPSFPTTPTRPCHNPPRQHHQPVILSAAKDPASIPPHRLSTRPNSPRTAAATPPPTQTDPHPTTPRQPLHCQRNPDADRASQSAKTTPSTSTTPTASPSTVNPGNQPTCGRTR